MVDMGVLVGPIRCFGLEGPPYEGVRPTIFSSSGEAQKRIHIFESGEDADFAMSDILRDPEAD